MFSLRLLFASLMIRVLGTRLRNSIALYLSSPNCLCPPEEREILWLPSILFTSRFFQKSRLTYSSSQNSFWGALYSFNCVTLGFQFATFARLAPISASHEIRPSLPCATYILFCTFPNARILARLDPASTMRLFRISCRILLDHLDTLSTYDSSQLNCLEVLSALRRFNCLLVSCGSWLFFWGGDCQPTFFFILDPTPLSWPDEEEFADRPGAFVSETLCRIFRGDISSTGVHFAFYGAGYFLSDHLFQQLLDNLSVIKIVEYVPTLIIHLLDGQWPSEPKVKLFHFLPLFPTTHQCFDLNFENCLFRRIRCVNLA